MVKGESERYNVISYQMKAKEVQVPADGAKNR